MAPKLAAKSVASTAADAAHAELSKFVESRSPGIVNEKPNTAQNFDGYLKTVDLQNTNALVTDFLDVSSASKITLLDYLSGFHLTYKVTERRQETRRGIPYIRRRSTRKIIPCALLRSTYQEKEHGVRESYNISCARPAVL
jgi:hypothetical protein